MFGSHNSPELVLSDEYQILICISFGFARCHQVRATEGCTFAYASKSGCLEPTIQLERGEQQ